jgi:hypothetical protein
VSSPYALVNSNLMGDWARPRQPAVAPRPRSMMDDETAAEVSRMRSRTSQERDSMMGGRRLSFNDRGGIPGRSFRPASFASDAPPITPEMLLKAYRTSSEQRQASGNEQAPPPPPPHSPRPFSIAYAEDYSDMAVAAPPALRARRYIHVASSPRPAQTAVWNAPRHSGGYASETQPWDPRGYDGYNQGVEQEPLYPEIPLRQNQHQQGRMERVPPQEYSSSPQDYSRFHDNYAQALQQGYLDYGASYRHPSEHDGAFVRQSRRNSMFQDYQNSQGRPIYDTQEPARRRPLPSPGPRGAGSNSRPSRPHSQAPSVHSFASSLAEELHPPDRERSQPPPQFGRYSGGLSFDYERDNGFGGSAGTRSVSGKAGATRREVALRASFGIDLGDVPTTTGPWR